MNANIKAKIKIFSFGSMAYLRGIFLKYKAYGELKELQGRGAKSMKKEIIAIGAAAVVLVALVIYFGIYGGETKIQFEQVPEKAMPRELEAEIIPNYRDIERALACRVGDDVYVLAMRGEMPTTGYEIQISKLEMETKDNKTNLIVYADFADPAEPENMAQVTSYPVAVVKTDLTGLPDTIQLQSSYKK